MIRFIVTAIAACLPATITHACESTNAQQMLAIRSVMHADNPRREALDALHARRHEIYASIRQALFDQAPDLKAIASLRREENAIAIETSRLEHIASEHAMASLNYCEKVAYLRAVFPGPVTTVDPPERAPSEPPNPTP